MDGMDGADEESGLLRVVSTPSQSGRLDCIDSDGSEVRRMDPDGWTKGQKAIDAMEEWSGNGAETAMEDSAKAHHVASQNSFLSYLSDSLDQSQSDSTKQITETKPKTQITLSPLCIVLF